MGTISARVVATGTAPAVESIEYELALAFGRLAIPAGGLQVHGERYARAVALAAGGSVKWTVRRIRPATGSAAQRRRRE